MDKMRIQLNLATLLIIGAAGCGDSDPISPAQLPSPNGDGGQPGTGRELAAVEHTERLRAAVEHTEKLLPAMTLDQKIRQIYNLPVLNEELQDEDPPCEFQEVGRHIE